MFIFRFSIKVWKLLFLLKIGNETPTFLNTHESTIRYRYNFWFSEVRKLCTSVIKILVYFALGQITS